jgi:hypothetical protein
VVNALDEAKKKKAEEAAEAEKQAKDKPKEEIMKKAPTGSSG